MVFSKPASYSQAWELQKEPRYWHQFARRNALALRQRDAQILRSELEQDSDQGSDWDHDGDGRPAPAPNLAHRDWAMSLGAGATVGAGQFPAKFTFNVNATPSCAADYVAFNTSKVGSATVPSIVAFNNLYSSQSGGVPAGLCGTNGPSVA